MEHHEMIASDGTRLHFGLTGPQSGPAMLLIHGLGAAGGQFAADAEWFGQHGFRVLLPDLRGHGQSGVPETITAASFTQERMRADLYDMMDHAGMAAAHWVGNSLGGILTLGAAGEAPQRLQSLILFGTPLALHLPPVGGVLPLLDRVPGRRIASAITARNTTKNKAAWPLIAQMLRQYDRRAIGAVAQAVRRYDHTSAAVGWQGPALVLVGGEDKSINHVLLPQLNAIEGRENWRIVHLPEGGHCSNLDATEDWRKAILSFVSAPVALA